ncbi:hypothetical protein D3C85_1522450 [compost metagenome]
MIVGVDLFIELTEYVRVLHIGCRTFQAIEAQHPQAMYVIAHFGFIGIESKLCRLLQQGRHIATCQLQSGHWMVDANRSIQQTTTRRQ